LPGHQGLAYFTWRWSIKQILGYIFPTSLSTWAWIRTFSSSLQLSSITLYINSMVIHHSQGVLVDILASLQSWFEEFEATLNCA